MSEWQPIETAPKDGHTRVLLFRPGWKESTTVGWFNRYYQDWRSVPDVPFNGEVTHWMPLPAPPVCSVKEEK